MGGGRPGRLQPQLPGGPRSSRGGGRSPLAAARLGARLRPLVAGIISAGRWWTAWMISVLSIDVDVTARPTRRLKR